VYVIVALDYFFMKVIVKIVIIVLISINCFEAITGIIEG